MFRLCFDFKLEGGFDYNSGSILKIKKHTHTHTHIYIYIYMDAKKSTEEEGETNSRNNVHTEYNSARERYST